MATVDTEMMHKAPMVLREAGSFPYREGLIFEGEVLAKGGKQAAFAGMFARPPRSTHEVLEPRAYLEREKVESVVIPDVRGIVTTAYEVYDSGSFGELDVRALLRQFGEKRSASDDLAAAWQSGSYVAFKRSQGGNTPTPTTTDLALLYVSHWKSKEAAERFARFYATTVTKRYKSAGGAGRSSLRWIPLSGRGCADFHRGRSSHRRGMGGQHRDRVGEFRSSHRFEVE